ncbi:hypothetical protein EVAR_25717_1 [Eumeta japonica]|uniref:Uncharacterized protein n=1 Tax=Eumeta variegata TaxID=151549 RepID=A0A4C1YPJ0_EUMVA|nr:hypothetical protein EVAR_25717_1 [Eumeta japonica]
MYYLLLLACHGNLKLIIYQKTLRLYKGKKNGQSFFFFASVRRARTLTPLDEPYAQRKGEGLHEDFCRKFHCALLRTLPSFICGNPQYIIRGGVSEGRQPAGVGARGAGRRSTFLVEWNNRKVTSRIHPRAISESDGRGPGAGGVFRGGRCSRGQRLSGRNYRLVRVRSLFAIGKFVFVESEDRPARRGGGRGGGTRSCRNQTATNYRSIDCC